MMFLDSQELGVISLAAAQIAHKSKDWCLSMVGFLRRGICDLKVDNYWVMGNFQDMAGQSELVVHALCLLRVEYGLVRICICLGPD
jgi:hypothetical protein